MEKARNGGTGRPKALKQIKNGNRWRKRLAIAGCMVG
jgi:hypothetical protein